MRWFSHRARTWKDTVLKIKIKKKAKGFTLVATALAVLCWIFIAQAFFMMSSGTLSTVKAERTAYQAEQNTALDVSRLKALDYDDLDSKGAHARKVIEGVGDGNWESEVTIDPEQPLNGGDDDAKLRIAHVKVYRTGDTTSRYSLDVPLTSQGSSNGNGMFPDFSKVILLSTEEKYPELLPYAKDSSLDFTAPSNGFVTFVVTPSEWTPRWVNILINGNSISPFLISIKRVAMSREDYHQLLRYTSFWADDGGITPLFPVKKGDKIHIDYSCASAYGYFIYARR